MIRDWKIEHCAMKPEPLELIARDIYMERRNIHEVEHEGIYGQDGYTDWECESREIGVSDYNMLKELASIKSEDVIDAYTMQLIEEGIL